MLWLTLLLGSKSNLEAPPTGLLVCRKFTLVFSYFTITVYFLGYLTRLVVTYSYDALRYQLLELTNFNANTIKKTKKNDNTHTQLYLCFASVYRMCSYQWMKYTVQQKGDVSQLNHTGATFQKVLVPNEASGRLCNMCYSILPCVSERYSTGERQFIRANVLPLQFNSNWANAEPSTVDRDVSFYLKYEKKISARMY